MIDRTFFFLLFFFFYWSLRGCKSPQASRTLLGYQVDLNTAVVWVVSTCPLLFRSFCPFGNPLEIIPSALNTISITVTFMFYSF